MSFLSVPLLNQKGHLILAVMAIGLRNGAGEMVGVLRKTQGLGRDAGCPASPHRTEDTELPRSALASGDDAKAH